MKKLWIVLSLIMFTVSAVPVTLADAPVEGRAGRAELRFLEGMIDHHQMALDMANDCLAKATTETVTTTCQNIIDAQTAEITLMQGWLLEWYNVDYSIMSMNDMIGMGMSAEMFAQMDTMMGMDMSTEMRPQMEQMYGMMGMMMSGEIMPGMNMMSMMQQMSGMMDTMMGMDMSAEIRPQMEQMHSMMNIIMSGMGRMDQRGMNMDGMPTADHGMMMGMMAGFNRLEGVEYEFAWLESMIDHHDDAIHMSERLLERVPEGEGHAELRELAGQIMADQSAEIEILEQLILDLAA